MNNVVMKVDRIIGLPKEYNPAVNFQEASWTQVGLFDDNDGTDSDTRLGRVITSGGCVINFVDYIPSQNESIISYFGSSVDDIPGLDITPGKQYILSYILSSSNNSDSSVSNTTTKVYLGSQSTVGNSISSSNTTGYIEGIVTATENQLKISGFVDTQSFGSFIMTYLSIREYDPNEIVDQIDLIEDISFPIVYQLDDITNPDKKKSSFSRTITIPGTKNNNKIFQHIFDIESDSGFNPNKSLPVIVYSDSLEIFRGILKLDSIYHNDFGQIQYDITLLSNITDLLYTNIGEKELEDLDFSEWNHIMNVDNQVNSWGPDFGTGNLKRFGSNYSGFNGVNPKGEGYVYVLMNNGLGTMYDHDRTMNGQVSFVSGPSFRTADIFPGIYVREILSKIFKAARKTWNSNFLDSNLFRKLVVPFSDWKILLSDAQLQSRKFNALSSPLTIPILTSEVTGSVTNWNRVIYNNDSTGGGFDGVNSNYNTSTSIWTCVKGGIYNFTANLQLIHTYTGLLTYTGSVPNGNINTNFYLNEEISKLKIYKTSGNGLVTDLLNTVVLDMALDENDISGSTSNGSRYNVTIDFKNLYLTTGETIYLAVGTNHSMLTTLTNTIREVSGSFPNFNITISEKPAPGLYYQSVTNASYLIEGFFNDGDPFIVGTTWIIASYFDSSKVGKILTITSGPTPNYSDAVVNEFIYFSDTNDLSHAAHGYYRNTTNNGSPTLNLNGVFYTPIYGLYRYVPTYWRPSTHKKLDESIWSLYSETQKLTLGGSANLVVNDLTNVFYNDVVNTGIGDGDEIDLNDVVPKNIKQKDFLLSLVKMFNLFMVIDKDDPNIINIEPRDDFYKQDFISTWKFDIEKEIKIEPLSQLDAKKYNFLYTNDDDYINKHYIDNYDSKEKRAWGHFTAEYDNDFLDGENDVKIIFSPTPVYRPYPNKTALPSLINENEAPYGKGNIRILFYNGRDTREPVWSHIYQSGSTTNVSSRYLPAFNMYDDMFYPNNSLVWGHNGTSYYWASAGPLETYKLNITPQSLYNKYWSRYMRDISSKDSKLITANIKLTPSDILNLDFSKLYYIDNHWLRLNKINNYDPNSNETTNCEFLKYNEGRGFTGSYTTGATVSGGRGFKGDKWTIKGGLGLLRLATDPLRAESKMTRLGGIETNQMTSVEVVGVSNTIHNNTERIRVIGDENVISSGVKRSEIINSNRVTIAPDLINVFVVGTNDVIITESNVSYINGVKFKDGIQIFESNIGKITKLDGGLDELSNIDSINEVDLIDGGLDELRPKGSFNNINKVEGGYNETQL